MKYVLTPTDDDILHYKKGSESKSHNYISRAFKNGKWIYTYAKNRLRGNKVTNQTKGTTPYNPGIKTKYISGPDKHTKKVLGEPRSYLGPNTHATLNNGQKESVTNATKGTTPYNPTIKTVDTNRDIGGTVIDTRHGGQEIRKALAENMTAETKVSGLTLFDNLMNTGMKYSVTNNTGRNDMSRVNSQYTPSYKTPDSSKHYTPNIKTNMPVNPSLKTPISYTQTNINTSKYDRLIRRDLGQKSLAEQYAEREKKKK